MAKEFTVKDSGARETFASGMVRDTQQDKPLWHLVASGPMLKRYAIHLTKGAQKYGEDNWLKASGAAESARFRASAFRHFMQWFLGDRDEDHAAAVIFNINGAEYVKEKMDADTENDARRLEAGDTAEDPLMGQPHVRVYEPEEDEYPITPFADDDIECPVLSPGVLSGKPYFWCEKGPGHGGKHGTPITHSSPTEW